MPDAMEARSWPRGILNGGRRPPICQESAGEVVQELRRRIDAGHEQMVAGTGAGHVEQMPLGLVDFFEVGIIGATFSITAPRNPHL